MTLWAGRAGKLGAQLHSPKRLLLRLQHTLYLRELLLCRPARSHIATTSTSSGSSGQHARGDHGEVYVYVLA